MAQGRVPPGRRSGTPSSRPQPEGLRSGERVTEPPGRNPALRQAPPASRGRNAASEQVIEAPLDKYRDVVRREWIDHNQHMNVGYYLVVFDFATDEFFRWVGLDDAHRRAREVTTFCLEAHVTYHQEVREGDPLRFTTVLLGHDAKRLHYIHQMYHAKDGYLAATNELMSLHVSQATRRSAPMAAEILERLARIQAAHDALPRPPQVGRTIGLARPARQGG